MKQVYAPGRAFYIVNNIMYFDFFVYIRCFYV